MFNAIRGECPASLSTRTSWTGEDVLQALHEVFYGKCYLCETKDIISLNVEHLSAHQGDVEKMYDWNNLFYVCARCNNFKRHHYNNLINCTNPEIDALRSIRHSPPTTPYSKAIIEPQNELPSTVETATLIDKIFNEKNTGNKIITSLALRKRVWRRYAYLVEQMSTFDNEHSLPAEKILALERIRNLMSKSQEYSAFLRWPIMESPELFELVGDAID